MRHLRTMMMTVILGLALVPAVCVALAEVAQTEINYLLEYVNSSGCEFYRNGTWYDAGSAQIHLRYKYNMLVVRNIIDTVEDFIDNAATKSSMSGQAYEVRCNGGNAEKVSQWLRDALLRYRTDGEPSHHDTTP